MKILKIATLLGVIAFTAQAQAAKTCIMFGDSIMSEVYPSTVGGPNGKAMELASNRAQMEADVIIRNLSSPGHALAGPTHSFANGVDLMREVGGMFGYYSCLIIQAGTNDFKRNVPWQDTVASLNAMLSEAQAKGKKVLVMDAIWRRDEATPNALGHTLAVYRWNIAIKCNEYPGTCFFATRNGTYLNDSSASPLYNANEVENGNELHLNAEGHRRFADWMMYEAAKNSLF
jgi:hypothetical protein